MIRVGMGFTSLALWAKIFREEVAYAGNSTRWEGGSGLAGLC